MSDENLSSPAATTVPPAPTVAKPGPAARASADADTGPAAEATDSDTVNLRVVGLAAGDFTYQRTVDDEASMVTVPATAAGAPFSAAEAEDVIHLAAAYGVRIEKVVAK